MKNWTTEIDNSTKLFQQHFSSLTEEELNWKPNEATWSIAQNIEHLIIINETYFPTLANLKSGNYKPPFIAKFGFIASLFGKMILGTVQPDRKKKNKTFPIWEPTISNIPADILDRFSKHQNQLKQEIEGTRAFIQKGTIISSPANKNIVYKLETAFDIMVLHEQRHLEQSKEVLRQLPASKVF